MTTTAIDQPLDMIERLRAAYAEARIGEVLEDVAISALHPCNRELTPDCDWTCVDELLAEPVRIATARAMEALAAGIATALEDAPDELLEHLAQQRIWFELGCE